jgi:hypothetical protein
LKKNSYSLLQFLDDTLAALERICLSLVQSNLQVLDLLIENLAQLFNVDSMFLDKK